MNNHNFLTPNDQNMVPNFSMSHYHQDIFSQQQEQIPGEFRVQHANRTQSALELQNSENNDRKKTAVIFLIRLMWY